MVQSSNFDFDWAIAPVPRDKFFDTYFERKPMVVRRGDPDYYSGLLSFGDIDRVVTTMGLSAPEISVTKADAAITVADYTTQAGAIDPVRVAQLFGDGATVILSGLQERLPELALFCRALESAVSARVQTNIYMTPAGSHGFNPHYDTHDVLVLQVEGTKEWRIYDTPVALPLPGQAFDPSQTEIGPETERVLLEPGDMIYVPRGLAHDAVATDRTSLHVTTGLMLRSWADFLAEAINAMAQSDPDFRKALPPGHAQPGFDAAVLRDRFGDLMRRAAEDAPVDKLIDGARLAFMAGRVPRVPGQLAQVSGLSDLDLDSQVCVRPHLVYDLDMVEASGQVRLRCQGAEIVLPDHAFAPLRHCLTAGVFRLGDMAGDLDDAGKLVLARRLVREGLMTTL